MANLMPRRVAGKKTILVVYTLTWIRIISVIFQIVYCLNKIHAKISTNDQKRRRGTKIRQMWIILENVASVRSGNDSAMPPSHLLERAKRIDDLAAPRDRESA